MSDEYNSDGASHEEQTKVLVMKDSQEWHAVPTESDNLWGLLNQMNVSSGSASISLNGSLSTDYSDPITTGDQVVIISRNKSGGWSLFIKTRIWHRHAISTRLGDRLWIWFFNFYFSRFSNESVPHLHLK